MKNLILAAFAALSLGTSVANAAAPVGDHSTVAGDRSATLMQQSKAVGSAANVSTAF